MSNCSLEQGLRVRLWVIDIPKQYQNGLVDLILKWVRSSGEEWTIKRLKSLKVDLFRRKAQLHPLTWVRKNRRGDVAGCIGGLYRWADKSEKNFRKAVQALMSYTMFVHSTATPSQVKKFTAALRAAPPEISQGFSLLYKKVKANFGIRSVERGEDVSLILYRGSPSKRKPQRGMRSCSQDSNILQDCEALVTNEWGRQLTKKFQDLYDPVFRGLSVNPVKVPFSVPSPKIDPYQVLGGKIAFIQEPGGKLRSVASPYLAHQLALRHFGKAVYAFVRTLPWDCTHDQSKPVPMLQDLLENGSTVHSVDLSSATDYFPLEVQVKLMKAVFSNTSDIDLFEILSKSTWISPEIGPVRWNRGQPLGLFPSFAVFTASHGLLLWYLNGCQWKKKFFVVGDDVVILDDDLYHRYIKILEEWSCPYSPDKSISSNQICEFAGKVITADSVVPQYKWREMSNDNFLDICQQLGARSRILLTRRQRTVFDLVKHCALPLGLNFSFPGSSLADMQDLSLTTFGLREEHVLDSLVDQAKVVWKNLYGSPYDPSLLMLEPLSGDLPEILKALATFDEKVRQVLHKLLPWFHDNMDPQLLSGVPGGLSNTELPPATLVPSRVTTLDRYERILATQAVSSL